MDFQTLLKRIFNPEKALGINSGASRHYLTAGLSGLVTINFPNGKEHGKIATSIKVDELLALNGEQEIERNGVSAVVFDYLIKGIGLYFSYGGTDGYLLIVSREDLAKL